jgi:predicted aspartyl protease
VLWIIIGILWVIAAATPAPAQTYSDCVIDLHRKTLPYAGASFWAPVTIRGFLKSDMRLTVEAMVDTGFAGELQLPRSIVDQLRAHNMVQSDDEKITVRLADGSQIDKATVDVHGAQLGDCGYWWFVRVIVADDGAMPLIGQGLLSAYFGTRIDYTNDQIHVLKSSSPPYRCYDEPTAAGCELDPGAVPFFIPSAKPRR